jgi:hypothetical protein
MVKSRGIGMFGGSSERFLGCTAGAQTAGSSSLIWRPEVRCAQARGRLKHEGAQGGKLCRRQRGAFGRAEGLEEQRLHASHL